MGEMIGCLGDNTLARTRATPGLQVDGSIVLLGWRSGGVREDVVEEVHCDLIYVEWVGGILESVFLRRVEADPGVYIPMKNGR